MGDQLDLRIMVETARFLCEFDTAEDFDAEEYLLDAAQRQSLAHAANELIGAFLAAETAYRSEFRLTGATRPKFVSRPMLFSFWFVPLT
jgi:hypothetical protein